MRRRTPAAAIRARPNLDQAFTPTLSHDQALAADAALTALEAQFSGLQALPASQKSKLKSMGIKSESFTRLALQFAQRNPQLVPPTVDLADILAQLEAMDRLDSRLQRLAELQQRAADGYLLLSSEVYAVALLIYGQMKLAKRTSAVDTQLGELAAHFARTPRRPKQQAE